MSTEMEFNEQLHVGDLVVVKSKEEIDDLKDDGGSLPWLMPDGRQRTLYFGKGMYKYCGILLEVDRASDGYYRLCLPEGTEIKHLEDEYGLQYGKSDLIVDLRSWSWVPSMLKWPDDFREEEIIGIDADSLFESLLV